MPFLFGSHLWDVYSAIREGTTIAFESAPQAFTDAGCLLAANAGRFETVAASCVE